MPKVSIIIPVFNMELYLKQCLDSVLGQTLRDIEVICINDGSTDGSLEILKSYARHDSRIIIIDQDNAGAGAARNNGLKVANGLFISFMDPDDYYPSLEILEVLYNKAIEYNVFVCGGSFSIDKDGTIETKFPSVHNGYVFNSEQIIVYKNYQFDYGYQRFIFNRQMLKENNIYFPEYYRFQDPPFFVRAMIQA